MRNNPKFSIVVALYNQLHYTQLFFASLKKNSTLPYELIAIDNGSTDGTSVWMAEQHVEMLIRWKSNYGTTKAWNCGIEESTGEYIVLINNDTLVAPGWLEGLLRVLEVDKPENLGTLSPSVNGVTNNIQTDLTDNGIKKFYAMAAKEQSQPHRLWKNSLIGSCIVIPRQTIESIGMFDERFFAYYNDLDYYLSLLTRNKICYTTSLSTVYHFGQASGNSPQIHEKKKADEIAFKNKWRQLHDSLTSYFNILKP